ncbi:hypothetical protein CTAYLR_009661 [Chrysophaeum taylorii]|uniref:Choline transporter-like protein n=1 Tax=Chrysophaeum taylorii TaxID=2483200 RepID=A0AAD7UKS1_9STRA|nr:hypothetical protein CTAYLR_009661 [Chrysophaeum taylorii]
MACCICRSARIEPKAEEAVDELPEMSEKDKAHPDNKALEVGSDFGGPCKRRRCTDVLCLLLLMACWFVMTFIGLATIPGSGVDTPRLNKGNPWRLVNGIDYKGQVCGINSDVKSKENLYYLPTGEGVCVKSCPKKTNLEAFICRYNIQDELDAINDTATRVAKGYDYVSKEKCSVEYKTKDTITPHYCIASKAFDYLEELESSSYEYVSDTTKGLNATTYDDNDKQEWWEKVYGDVFVAWPYIIGVGVGGAILVGFVYTFLLRIPGVLALIIWGLLAAVFLTLLAGAAFCYTTSQRWADENKPRTHTKTQADGMLYTSYVLAALAGLWFCCICCLRKRIMLAIGIVKEAAKALATMPLLVFFPMVQTGGLMFFLVPWFVYSLFLGSSGELKTRDGGSAGTYKEMKYDNNTYYAGWYMIFTYYWTSEFIVALGQIFVALAVSTWYFTKDKSHVGNITVVSSFKLSVFYHSGTAAFGSLVIAIVKTIRAIVAYIKKKANKIKRCRQLVKIILCVISCCLWCIEKCLKFLNKNAYIQTAIFGYSFCKAARCAFFLILRNIARISALSIVSGFVLLLGKAIITGGAALLAYIVIDYTIADDLNSIIAPMVLTVILAYWVAKMFNEIWGMAMSTILQCFIADEEIYKGDKNAMYAGASLKATVSNANKGKYKGEPNKVSPMP